MKALSSIKMLCEYLGGSRNELTPSLHHSTTPSIHWFSSLWRGLWWALLAGAILLFCGQTSKFIYIDF